MTRSAWTGRLVHGVLSCGVMMGYLHGIHTLPWWAIASTVPVGLFCSYVIGVAWEYRLQLIVADWIRPVIRWDPRPDEGAMWAFPCGALAGVALWLAMGAV